MLEIYVPEYKELWFRQEMMADEDTMSYNRAWGGTIPFPEEAWEDWYDYWVRNPEERFYRYITTGESRSFAGEAAWHYDEERGIYITDVKGLHGKSEPKPVKKKSKYAQFVEKLQEKAGAKPLK